MHPQVALASFATFSAPSLLAQPDPIQRSLSNAARGDITLTFSTRMNHYPRPYGLDLLSPTVPLENFSGFQVAEGAVLTTERRYASVYGWRQHFEAG